MYRLLFILQITLFSTSLNAQTIGVLEWDGHSDFITSSESKTTYLQLGLTSGKTYQQTQTYVSVNFSAFKIANENEAVIFANQLIYFSDPFEINTPHTHNHSNLGIDGALGFTDNALWDSVIFAGSNNKFGLIKINSLLRTVEYTPSIFNLFDANNIATADGAGWLVVSNNTSPVPETSIYLMLLIGLCFMKLSTIKNNLTLNS